MTINLAQWQVNRKLHILYKLSRILCTDTLVQHLSENCMKPTTYEVMYFQIGVKENPVEEKVVSHQTR